MKHLIYFRSTQEWTHMNEVGSRRIRGQSSEIRWIRWYSIGDDPRDIAWKKWTGTENLYTKERESSLHPRVYLISLLVEKYSDFSTPENPQTKQEFLTRMREEIQESAQVLRFPFRELSPENDSLIEMSIEKSILLILGDIDSIHDIEKFSHLSRNNDVIFLFLLHPEELSPSHIFESRKIKSSYHEALEKLQTEIEKQARNHNIEFLPCTTKDIPSLLLNNFFKYRYV